MSAPLLPGATPGQSRRAYLQAAMQVQRMRASAKSLEETEKASHPETLKRLALASFEAEVAALAALSACRADLLNQAERALATCPRAYRDGVGLCWRFGFAGRRFLAVSRFDHPANACIEWREVYDLATDCLIVVSLAGNVTVVDKEFPMEVPDDAA